MTESSDLSRALRAMNAPGAGEDAALQFYHILAQTPLVLMLDREVDVDSGPNSGPNSGHDTVIPRLFDLPSGALVLAFESQDMLGEWAAQQGGDWAEIPYAVLPARIIAQQLSRLDLTAGGRPIALGLNFGAPSQMILPHGAMEWLAQMLEVAPQTLAARISSLAAPQNLPPALNAALRRALPAGTAAYLAAVRYDTGAIGHVLAIFDAQSEAPIARAIAESLSFSGLEAGAVDVTFAASNSPLAAQMRSAGVDFSAPAPIPSPSSDRSESPFPAAAPGLDPARPPKLR